MIKCSSEKSSEDTLQGDIYYSFNWENTLKGYPEPAYLRYCFYPSNNGPMIQMDVEANNLKFTLPPDKYKVLIFNCDASNITFRDLNDFDKAMACIPTSKAADGTTTPGFVPLYAIVENELTVEPGMNNPIEFKPIPLVRKVSLNIKIEGMENVVGCKGSLSGIASAISLSKHEIIPNAITDMPFEATTSEKGVNACLLVLGKPLDKGTVPPLDCPKNEMKLDFTMTDGSTTSTSVDLGSSINDSEGSSVDVDIEASVTKSPTFSIRINRWEVAFRDSLTIQ